MLESKRIEMDSKMKQKQIINDKVDETTKELRLLKNKLHTIKNNLLIHYHNLLNEGIDARYIS